MAYDLTVQLSVVAPPSTSVIELHLRKAPRLVRATTRICPSQAGQPAIPSQLGRKYFGATPTRRTPDGSVYPVVDPRLVSANKAPLESFIIDSWHTRACPSSRFGSGVQHERPFPAHRHLHVALTLPRSRKRLATTHEMAISAEKCSDPHRELRPHGLSLLRQTINEFQ
jgi:hypothetical protein